MLNSKSHLIYITLSLHKLNFYKIIISPYSYFIFWKFLLGNRLFYSQVSLFFEVKNGTY